MWYQKSDHINDNECPMCSMHIYSINTKLPEAIKTCDISMHAYETQLNCARKTVKELQCNIIDDDFSV